MVRKQCFEVGCLGGKFVQKCGVVFQVGCDSELYLLWFMGEKKKRKKKIKPVLQVPTSHKIHQRAYVCCLTSGGKDVTTGITASPLCPEPVSWGIDQSDVKAYFMYESQVPYKGSLCFLLGRSGCFPQKILDRAFGLATLGLLLLVPQAGGAGVG